MSRREAKTRAVSRADALTYLSKAREFLTAAEDSFEHGNFVATAGNAVHAGIAAADAITAARAGEVWKGEHTQAARHLESAGGRDGKMASPHLGRLIPLKNQAEYDPSPVSRRAAEGAVKAATQLVALAERAVAGGISTS
jgi:HEPN domain-containing protein